MLRASSFVALSFVVPFFGSFLLDTDLVLAPLVDSSFFFAGFFFGELFAMMEEDDASDFAAIIFCRVGRYCPVRAVTFNRSTFLGKRTTTDGWLSLKYLRGYKDLPAYGANPFRVVSLDALFLESNNTYLLRQEVGISCE